MKKCIHLIKRYYYRNGWCSKDQLVCTGTLCPFYVKVDTRGIKTYGVEFYSPNDPFITEEEMRL